jgi:hypothetical protein
VHPDRTSATGHPSPPRYLFRTSAGFAIFYNRWDRATPSYMGGEATGERVPVRLLGDGFPEAIDPIGEELGIGQ